MNIDRIEDAQYEIYKMYKDGVKQSEIARLAGVSRQWVNQVLKKSGAIVSSKAADEKARKSKQKTDEAAAKLDAEKFAVEHNCKSPVSAYYAHRRSAKDRGIDFLMSFAEWWGMWRDKFLMRGTRKGQYVMCRTHDSGAYQIGNVRIDFATANGHEKVTSNRLRSGSRTFKSSGVAIDWDLA